jgi:putative tryptophan/tyrosine transport system substrate-binding protein
MKRREFITLLGGTAAAWPLAAGAQQPTMPVVGWLSSRNSETDALVLPAFRQGLNAQGYIEGRNVTVEYRWADGQYDRVPEFAVDLVRRSVALIVAVGSAGTLETRVAQAVGTTIPIVFLFSEDPVQERIVPNINRPAGNITGVIGFLGQLGPKRLGLLHDLLPHATTIAVLANPSAMSVSEATDLPEAARALGVQVKILNASTARDLDVAFASLAQTGTDAVLVATDPFFFTRANQIVALAARYSVPALYFRREFTAAGGLMSYGSSAAENYRVLGDYAGRILNGAKPGDLPVQLAAKYELIINLKTARTLGLEVPPGLSASADEVIE